MDSEIVILNEVSQTEKDEYHMIPLKHGTSKQDKKQFLSQYFITINGV